MFHKKWLLSSVATLVLMPSISAGLSNEIVSAEEEQVVSQIESSSYQELGAYLYQGEDGYLHLDRTSASQAGYSEDLLNLAELEVADMNRWIDAGGYVNADLSITLYASGPRTRSAGDISYATRAFGGAQQYHISAAEAQQMINELQTAGTVVGSLKRLYPRLSFGLQGFVVPTLAQLKQAASSGRGLIMYVQPNYGAPDLPPSIWFTPA